MAQKIPVESDQPKTKQNNALRTIVEWVDTNILPTLAILALLGLAVKGLSQYLPAMSKEAQLVASIAAVAFLGFKAFAKR